LSAGRAGNQSGTFHKPDTMWRIVGTAAAAPAATATKDNDAPTINQMMLRRMGHMLPQFPSAHK
jgi:hypothetical protein